MAKAKKEAPSTSLRCTICQEEVTPETYASHIQAKHTAPAPPAVPPPQTLAQAWQPPTQSGISPISGSISGKDLAGGHYLKGEDVPTGTNEVRFRVVQFVHDPGGRSKLAAQISETYGKTLFGFNVTNIRALMALGYQDLQTVAGKTVVCMIGMAPNPQKNGAPTKALFVSRVE